MTYNPPSSNPADLDTLTGAYREIFNKLMQNIDGILPAQVLAYQAGPPALVQVQPLINKMGTSGQVQARAAIASVPVIQLGGGGFVMSFPLSPGNLGFILANDRDISLFRQTLAQASPNTSRVKNFADAIFIPFMPSGYTLAEGDNANVVIQSLNGDVKISWSTTTITVKAPTVVIEATTANVNANTVNLAGEDGAGVARIGDTVADGVITSGSDKVFAN